MIDVREFRLKAGKTCNLKKWPTAIKAVYKSEADYEALLAEHVAALSERQQLLYASHQYAVLVIFQGMDASGKDSAIKHVMSGVNPQGCQVFSFKQPSTEELNHDFLWRAVARLPEKGRIGIFNRSYYEEVLVPRVHPDALANQAIPDLPKQQSKIWSQRYKSINHFERHLHGNGTRIVKVFLHMSKGQQRKRFLERLDDPQKRWKFGTEDVKERALWSQYMDAYGECFEATSTAIAPWHIVPADDKQTARLLISKILLGVLKDLKMEYPQATAAREQELKEIRAGLAREK